MHRHTAAERQPQEITRKAILEVPVETGKCPIGKGTEKETDVVIGRRNVDIIDLDLAPRVT